MNEQLNNRLKVLRAEKKVTQEELGNACGLSRQSINAIEKGKYVPTIVSALKIAKYFNVSVEDIFILK
ncbi:MAG: helix-turn-helix transcriptional regulator [Ignavibacteriales bacterium]|nr:helix-turn-helix transcriptional regulator [Ignavibacteriales bacterium]MCB9219133.1 helix-turn-helix transcriptional regulator [Ignavibacteriales bacterium]